MKKIIYSNGRGAGMTLIFTTGELADGAYAAIKSAMEGKRDYKNDGHLVTFQTGYGEATVDCLDMFSVVLEDDVIDDAAAFQTFSRQARLAAARVKALAEQGLKPNGEPID